MSLLLYSASSALYVRVAYCFRGFFFFLLLDRGIEPYSGMFQRGIEPAQKITAGGAPLAVLRGRPFYRARCGSLYVFLPPSLVASLANVAVTFPFRF